jgi:hypothetical protein
MQFSKNPVKNRYALMRFQPAEYFQPIVFEGLDEFSKILRFWGFLAVDYCGEVSSISLRQVQIEINIAGYAYDPGGIITFGRWQEMRFAEALPFDYEPPKK